MYKNIEIENIFTIIIKLCSNMSKPMILAPSIIAMDFTKGMNQEIFDKVNWLHIDVMDGHFVPNITLGPHIINCYRKKLPNMFFDCHMMVDNPKDWIYRMKECGANQYTFHIETTNNPREIIKTIRNNGMHVGIAINPKTNWNVLKPLLDDNLLDTILVMMVEPGFSGQELIPEMINKVEEIHKYSPNCSIEVDGGINIANVELLKNAGANISVAGTSIFDSDVRDTFINKILFK